MLARQDTTETNYKEPIKYLKKSAYYCHSSKKLFYYSHLFKNCIENGKGVKTLKKHLAKLS